MNQTDPRVDALLANPRWQDERIKLRAILLDCGLVEAIKWGKLCYTFDAANVAIIYGLKDYCGLGFFKGALLRDAKGILYRQGEHSQAARLIRFTDLGQIIKAEPTVKDYIHEAIEIEKAGLKVAFKEKDALVFPDELIARLEGDPDLKAAFSALTPGRQRGYNLFFSAPKQSQTRTARIEKHVERILLGKGMNDR